MWYLIVSFPDIYRLSYSVLPSFVLSPNPTHLRVQTIKVSKGAKIRNRYNQVPHMTKDTNGKVTNSKLDTTNESQEVSPFQAGDHKAHINRRAQRHSKHKAEQKHKRITKPVFLHIKFEIIVIDICIALLKKIQAQF